MNYVVRCCTLVLLITMPCCANPSPVEDVSPAVPIPTTLPSTADFGADLVVEFYGALLQKEPPTREQELALFEPLSALRSVLVRGKGDPRDAQDVEPMERTPEERMRRRLQDARVTAAGPVVLTYFREHRDWFLPKNMKSLADIQISSTYNFRCNLESLKDPPRPGRGAVIALFTHDKNAPMGQMRVRTIIFKLEKGRIDADAIYLDGYQGKTTLELLLDEGARKP